MKKKLKKVNGLLFHYFKTTFTSISCLDNKNIESSFKRLQIDGFLICSFKMFTYRIKKIYKLDIQIRFYGNKIRRRFFGYNLTCEASILSGTQLCDWFPFYII